ncbi:alpha/beta fold hydrolase [Paenibacillus sacheonensis]|uniref:Alpha/beta fold hydrolase n=1 Tax=Paenibacillus sacheonensis TaxID=742054 RepID=A0A7X5C012_9BACL|nr:alpha/beta hydrolase [Paenibacillus sacheonensis]MBM7567630.1 pimeloyl-ACP methyl ester carboxylesterase [Paenibacillus sacheonensis]NBC71267.1 alpha/beta fold hydrolase [Paenibacillus sacheonensis]
MNSKRAYSLHHTASADGTRIGYRRSGSGPGLVLVHGAFVSGHEYEKLAAELANDFTVYNMDRRGRLYSGAQGERYGIGNECEDVLAVVLETGAAYVFGHSYGGLIALETARAYSDAVSKIAVYEPTVSVGGSFPSGWMPDYKRAMEQGRDLSAFVHFIKGVGVSEPFARLPAWLIKLALLPSLIFWEGRKLREKLPTLIREMNETFRLDSTAGRYETIKAPALVMAGSKSPAFMQIGARAAADAIRGGSFMQLEGLGHNAPDLFNQRRIAAQLKAFFYKA